MRIQYNVSAMRAGQALSTNESRLTRSMERLSSGLKINRAKDDPAGLAMGKRMNAQIEGVSIAGQNAGDGISILETADGALGEISDMLQRMNELAVKAANGTMSDKDRATIQEEIKQLKEEVTRVASTTEFNGQMLLDGTFALKGYTNREEIEVNSYSEDVPTGVYTLEYLKLTEELDEKGIPTGKMGLASPNDIRLGADFPQGSRYSLKDNILTVENGADFWMKLDLNAATAGEYTGADALKADITGKGAMRLQIGANEGQVLIMNMPDISLRSLHIEELDVSTGQGAQEAIEGVAEAIAELTRVRSRLGAYQNRLESTVSSLDATEENMTSAYSRIMDVDMAEEMTRYTTMQVLTQAGTSMLAQANERPSQVLQLLQ